MGCGVEVEADRRWAPVGWAGVVGFEGLLVARLELAFMDLVLAAAV